MLGVSFARVKLASRNTSINNENVIPMRSEGSGERHRCCTPDPSAYRPQDNVWLRVTLSINARWGRGKPKSLTAKDAENGRRERKGNWSNRFVLLDRFGDGAALLAKLDLEGFHGERGFGLK